MPRRGRDVKCSKTKTRQGLQIASGNAGRRECIKRPCISIAYVQLYPRISSSASIEYNLLRLGRTRSRATQPRHLPLLAQLGRNPTRMFRPRHRCCRLGRWLDLFRRSRRSRRRRRTCRPTLPSGIAYIRATSCRGLLPSPARLVPPLGLARRRTAHLAREEFGIAFGPSGVGFGFLDVIGALAVFLFPDSGKPGRVG